MRAVTAFLLRNGRGRDAAGATNPFTATCATPRRQCVAVLSELATAADPLSRQQQSPSFMFPRSLVLHGQSHGLFVIRRSKSPPATLIRLRARCYASETNHASKSPTCDTPSKPLNAREPLDTIPPHVLSLAFPPFSLLDFVSLYLIIRFHVVRELAGRLCHRLSIHY